MGAVAFANNHFSQDTYGVRMKLDNRFSTFYAIIPLTALFIYCIIRSVHAPFSDFAGYYFGSWELWRGNYQTAYDTYALNQSIAWQGYTGVFVCYTPFPPFTALVMGPFLWLPVAAAKFAFNVFSAGLFLFTIYRSMQFFKLPAWVVALVPVIFCIPLRNHIMFGQGYLLLTVLLLEGFMAYKKGNMQWAGFLWALAMLFKVFPVCILFFLVLRRQYKQLGYCLAFAAVIGMISLWCVGFTAWKHYLFTLMPRLNNGELNDSYTYIFQSAFMLFRNLFVYDALQNPGAYNSVLLFVLFNACFKALVVAFAVRITIQKDDFTAFGVCMMASMLISPNGSTYSLILLLIPLMGLRDRRLWYAMGLLLLICWVQVHWFAAAPVMARFPRLYLMLVLFGIIISGTALKWKPALAFMMVFVLADAGKFFPQPDHSRYLLTTRSLLIYEYAIKENTLTYYFWNDNGSNEVATDSGVYTAEDIPIINNQLVYKGKQLTQTNDLKKQAMLVNGNQVVYLSDKNRGVGFYTLRVIDVN